MSFRVIAPLTLAAVVSLPALAAEVELKLSHFLPPVHGIHTDFIEPWTKDLAACTNGKVNVTIFHGGTQRGNVARQQEQVTAGVVDIAHGLHGIPRGRFPRTSLVDMPFLTTSAAVATRALWAIYPEHLAPEYKGLKVLALHAHNGGLIHTRDKKVTTIEDLKGLRLRTPSPAVSLMLEQLGAVPQGLPPGQVYEALQKGTIDGTVFPWDPVNSFKLAEVLKYHLDAGAYTVSFFFVMSESKYNALPPDVRACVDKLSGDALVAKFGEWWTVWDRPGLEAARARGNEITRLSPDQRARLEEQLRPVVDKYLKQVESEGVKNPQEIYEALRRKIAEFEKNT